MKDYKEVTSEILKRRDAHKVRVKKLTKRIISLMVVLVLCVSVGTGAWMISRDGGNAPAVYPVESTGTDDITALPDWIPEPYDPEAEHEHNSDRCQCPPPRYLYEYIETDELCIIDEDTQLPDTLPVFYKKSRTGISDGSYDRATHTAVKESFLKLVYGEDFEELYISDLYLEPNPNGDRFIRVGSERIYIPLEITAVEEYRDMSYREAFEYATSTKYYKAIFEFLGLGDVKNSGYVSSKKSDGNGSYSYSFLLASPKTDFTDGMMKNTESYIHIKMSFVRTKGNENIRLSYYAYRQFDENSEGYDKTVEQKTLTISEVMENSQELKYIKTDDIIDTFVTIEYRHSTNATWNTPHCVMPFYNICINLKDPEEGYTYSEIFTVPAVEGMYGYNASNYY